MSAVFLDLDGTLVDSRRGIVSAMRAALAELGLPVPGPDELDWALGPPLLESFAKLGAPDPAGALRLYRALYADGPMFDLETFPGIEAALARMAGTRRLFLATAKALPFAERITARFGLDRFLERQFGPSLDGRLNDKGELLAHACRELALDPASAVMVGDRENDMSAARRNGMPFVAAAWGYAADGELDGADALCRGAGELPAAVEAAAAPPGGVAGPRPGG